MINLQTKLGALFKRYENNAEKLAADLGCSKASLYNWKSGKNVPSRMAASRIDSVYNNPARSAAEAAKERSAA